MKIGSLFAASIIGLTSPSAQGEEVCSPEIRRYIQEPETICDSESIKKEVSIIVWSIIGLWTAGYLVLRRRRENSDQQDIIDILRIPDHPWKLPSSPIQAVEESIRLLKDGKIEASEASIKKALDLSGHREKSIYIAYLSLLHDVCVGDPSGSHKKQYFIFFHRTCMHFRNHILPEFGHEWEQSLTQEEFEKIRDWWKEIDPSCGLYSAESLDVMFAQRRSSWKEDVPILHDAVEEWSLQYKAQKMWPDTEPAYLRSEGEDMREWLTPAEREKADRILAILEKAQDIDIQSILELIDEVSIYYPRGHSGLQEKIKFTILWLWRLRRYDYISYGMKKIWFSNKETTLEKAIQMMEQRKIKIAENGEYKYSMIESDIALTLWILMATDEDSDFSYARGFIGFIKKYCGDNTRLFSVFKKKLIKKGEMAARLFDIHLVLMTFND